MTRRACLRVLCRRPAPRLFPKKPGEQAGGCGGSEPPAGKRPRAFAQGTSRARTARSAWRQRAPPRRRPGRGRDVSRPRHRDVVGQGGADRPGPAPRRRRQRAARRLPAAARLVRAGSGGLVAGGRGGGRRARAAARRAARRRALGADARRGLPRPRRPGAAAGDPVERRPGGGGMRRARGGLPALARGRRQHRDAGLHRAEAPMARQARAGGLRAGRQRAAAQGLRAAAADRPPCLRDVGRLGHALARRRLPRLVRRPARGDRAHAGAHAAARRGQRELRHPAAGGRGALGRAGGRRGRRRGGGQRRGRLRHRGGAAGHCLRVARHLWRALCLEPRLLTEHRWRGARFRPCHPRDLAPDGRDPVGGRQPRMAFADHRPAGRRPRRRVSIRRRRRR
jgi:hypothetical protein